MNLAEAITTLRRYIQHDSGERMAAVESLGVLCDEIRERNEKIDQMIDILERTKAAVEAPAYDLEELMKCAGRELGMRRSVYPGRVSRGKMSEANAQKQIEMMENIQDFLGMMAAIWIADPPENQLNLFDQPGMKNGGSHDQEI